MTTRGESISRIRNLIKGVKQDAFITDRFLYSIIIKYAKTLIRRQDNENKIMKFQSLFEAVPCIELIEVDKVEACCTGIRTKCTIRRTKDKLPEVFEGVYGPLFRGITSLDRSQQVVKTYPSTFTNIANSSNYKYNNSKYYWYIDGHLYFPNIDWEGVLVEALWTDDVGYLKCDGNDCTVKQDLEMHIPEFLFSEVEQMVMRDFGIFVQFPEISSQEDKMSPLRS